VRKGIKFFNVKKNIYLTPHNPDMKPDVDRPDHDSITNFV